MTLAPAEAIRSAQDLDALYPALDRSRMTAGWHKKRPSLWKEPRTEFAPLHWRYDVGRAALDQAGRWIGTELAERRNLLLFNPVGDNDYATVRTMVTAYQMIKPGEYARAHQHTPNAMRLILDAQPGCFTVVNGVKLPMRTGDVLITPSSCWHSHYNEGSTNAYWIDVLDVPLVHQLEPMLFSELPEWHQKVDSEPQTHPFYFPPPRTRALLDAAPRIDGVRRVVLDTRAHLLTMELAMIEMGAGARRAVARDTASRIVAVVRGTGSARIGSLEVSWAPGDVMAVPAWHEHTLTAAEPAQLFEVSDEPTLRALGFYRTKA